MKYVVFIPIVAFLSLLLLAIIYTLPNEIQDIYDISQDEKAKPEIKAVAEKAFKAIIAVFIGLFISALIVFCSIGLYYL